MRTVSALFLALTGVRAGTHAEGLEFLAEMRKEEGVRELQSGLMYKVLRAGEGSEKPTRMEICEVHYEGWTAQNYPDGPKFDSSYDRGMPANIAPAMIIKGWAEAMQLMVEGDKWELYIPSELGEGDKGRPPWIGGGDVLVIVLELVRIKDDGTVKGGVSQIAVKPTAQDMVDAKLLYVKLKMDYTKNPQLTSVDGLKYVLGEGGATVPWATLPGLRHKYFIYNKDGQTCSGVYVFYDQMYLDAYLKSNLFKEQGEYPHVSKVKYEVHDVLAGTEKSIENYGWGSTPPTREDVSKAWMLIAHLKVKTDVTPEPALREFMAMQYTEQFNKENGPAGLRGKYFTYNSDMETVSGFYTFLDKASMVAYMGSDQWKSQAEAPNVASVTFSTHEVLPGTERAMDLGNWKQRPTPEAPKNETKDEL